MTSQDIKKQLKEPHFWNIVLTGRHTACKADKRDPRIQVTGGHAQHHAERTAEEYEGAGVNGEGY